VETLTLLLPTMVQFVGIVRSGVGALEVPYEGISELSPAADPPSGKMLKSGSCRVSKVQRDALDNE
jgi:hypothetical protein